MQAVGAESGAVSWLKCMPWRGRVLRLSSRALVPVGSKPNRRFRRLTCLKLVGTGLLLVRRPLEHPRPAPRMRSGTPSAPLSSLALPLSTGSFNPVTGQDHGAWT